MNRDKTSAEHLKEGVVGCGLCCLAPFVLLFLALLLGSILALFGVGQ
ncbi:MAG: hypothetical protein ACODAD_16065 [Planctomycetota bacterium]